MPRRPPPSALEQEAARLRGQYGRPFRQWLHPGEGAAETDLTGPPGGPYRGRGPRGWRRTDADLLDAVCAALADDPWIDATRMEVAVQDGVVVLRGAVDDRDQRRAAEDVALTVRGVVDVDNELKIEWPSQPSR